MQVDETVGDNWAIAMEPSMSGISFRLTWVPEIFSAIARGSQMSQIQVADIAHNVFVLVIHRPHGHEDVSVIQSAGKRIVDNLEFRVAEFLGKPQISRPPEIGGSSSKYICAVKLTGSFLKRAGMTTPLSV
jgi:hypothetical protein